jgi:hypothetical protein
MRGRNPRSHPEGGPTVVPGRTGAAWGRCRRQVIADSGDMCAVCGEYVDPHAPKFSDGQGEVDHVIPLRRLKQMYPDLVEYAAQANDPSNCRYVHRSPCHEDRGDPLLSRQPQRTRSSEWDDDLAGVDTGMANAHDLNEVVARLQAERDKPRPVHRISIG